MFLLCDAENLSQTSRVKVVYILYMQLISCLGFTTMKKGGKNNSSAYLDFDWLWVVSPIPHIPESAKGCIQFFEYVVHLVIHGDILREGAAEVGELVNHLQSLLLDGDVGPDVWFSRRCLVHHFCLFVLKVRRKLSKAIENLSTLFCMLGFIEAFISQSSANKNSLTISSSSSLLETFWNWMLSCQCGIESRFHFPCH